MFPRVPIKFWKVIACRVTRCRAGEGSLAVQVPKRGPSSQAVPFAHDSHARLPGLLWLPTPGSSLPVLTQPVGNFTSKTSLSPWTKRFLVGFLSFSSARHYLLPLPTQNPREVHGRSQKFSAPAAHYNHFRNFKKKKKVLTPGSHSCSFEPESLGLGPLRWWYFCCCCLFCFFALVVFKSCSGDFDHGEGWAPLDQLGFRQHVLLVVMLPRGVPVSSSDVCPFAYFVCTCSARLHVENWRRTWVCRNEITRW